MNAVLLKALMEQEKQAADRDMYAQKFNALEERYRRAVEQAYGLENAEDWMKEGWGGRAQNIFTSRFYDLIGVPRVAQGRSEMTATNPLLVALLRSQGFKDAFQGAREAEMQLPDESDPRAVLNYFQAVREMGKIPYSPRDKRLTQEEPATLKEDAKSIAEKYGY